MVGRGRGEREKERKRKIRHEKLTTVWFFFVSELKLFFIFLCAGLLFFPSA
jgi:hypothetical protein